MSYQAVMLGVLAQFIFLCTFGQVTPKHLQPQDYNRWERLGGIKISPDASYISYSIFDGSGKQSLMVKSLRKGASRRYSETKNAEFLTFKKQFVYNNKGDTLFVESYDGKPLQEVRNVAGFHTLADGRFLVLSDKNIYSPGLKEIRILDMANFTTKIVPDVYTLTVDPNKQKIAFSSGGELESKVTVLDPSKGIVFEKSFSNVSKVVKMAWSSDSRSLTFLLQKPGGDHFVDSLGVILDVMREDSFQTVNLKKVKGWENLEIARYSTGYPVLSHDKRNLFLMVSRTDQEEPDKEPHVEVWKSLAKRIYPYQRSGVPELESKLASISLESHVLKLISKESESETIRGLRDRFALNLDASAYQPVYQFGETYFDLRLVNLATGKDHMVDTQVKDYGRRMLFVEELESLIYYNQDHWRLYNPASRKTVIITQNIPNLITECANCNQGLAIGQNDKNFYVFDKLDLWQVDASGNRPKKLTNSAESGIEFRFELSYYGYGISGSILRVDPVKGIYLHAFNRKTGDTGYFKWSISRGLEKIVFSPMKYEFLQVLPHNKGYLYTRQAFDRSPEIIWQPTLKDIGQVVMRSNVQQAEYYWGRSEMIQYRSTGCKPIGGRDLNGALFYPANYDPTKKYPLIVSIYEDNTYTLHEYQNPGFNMFVDFNPTDYTSDGYFVLHPNLTPRENANPGYSMMENLQAAVDYMKSTGMIDEKRIGLYGHSFGGYEALFAATQTQDFATVIAGAAITDIVTDYFSHRELLKGPSFYRTEQMQMAMKRSYFEIPELYEANSPFRHIPNIKSPILLWTGKDDVNVGYEQSVQFYLGMLRWQKECTLLVYPDEDHVLAKPDNMQDLDRRMKQWFDCYLKGNKPADWIVKRVGISK